MEAAAQASLSRDLPGADEFHAALEAESPAESDVAIVHGDFRLDNLLVGGDDRVNGRAGLGNGDAGRPAADVAMMLAYRRALPGIVRHGVHGRLDGGRGSPTGVGDRGAVRRKHRPGLSGSASTSAWAYFKMAASRGHLLPLHRGETVGEGFERLVRVPDPPRRRALTRPHEGDRLMDFALTP